MPPDISSEEDVLSENAHRWIRENETLLIDHFASPRSHEADEVPVTLFMAGSPGAGKTEVSRRLVRRFAKKPVRIDADEIRALCPGYEGHNAHLFQKAANKGVNTLYDHSLKHGLNVILDGTFAYGNATENIGRSLKRGRKVEIFLVQQDPVVAWDFTRKREATEGRRVTKAVFINGWIRSRENVKEVKRTYGDIVDLWLVTQDIQGETVDFKRVVSDVDLHVKSPYTQEDLERLL